MAEVMIQADGLVKIYKTKQTEVLALQGLDLTVEEGELTALIGNSGSGKSTFLNMIGGLDRPSAGSLVVGGLRSDRRIFLQSILSGLCRRLSDSPLLSVPHSAPG